MSFARSLLAQRHLAVLVCAAALLLKLLVPAGYMIDTSHGRIAIAICPGIQPATMAMDTMAMPGAHGDMSGHEDKGQGRAEMPCAFSGLSAPVLDTIDPIQLAALIAFVMAVGLAGVVTALPSQPSWLRPPLRGPPAHL